MTTTRPPRSKAVFLAGVITLGTLLGTHQEDVSVADTSAPARPAAGGANVDWSGARLVTVQLVDERFIPEKLSFRHGIAYRLHLENNGTHMHEFTAPEFFKAIEMENPDVLEAERHELLLQPKERKDLYFVAPGPGRYRLTCADHDWDGMTGEITVE